MVQKLFWIARKNWGSLPSPFLSSFLQLDIAAGNSHPPPTVVFRSLGNLLWVFLLTEEHRDSSQVGPCHLVYPKVKADQQLLVRLSCINPVPTEGLHLQLGRSLQFHTLRSLVGDNALFLFQLCSTNHLLETLCHFYCWRHWWSQRKICPFNQSCNYLLCWKKSK